MAFTERVGQLPQHILAAPRQQHTCALANEGSALARSIPVPAPVIIATLPSNLPNQYSPFTLALDAVAKLIVKHRHAA